MLKFIHKVSQKSGMPPGSLVYIGEKSEHEVEITVTMLDYDSENVEERVIGDIEECAPYKDKPTATWISIYGIHDTEIIEKVGKIFDIHPLVLEDILNTSHRPKIEVFEKYLYTVIKMLSLDEATGEIKIEQVSIISMDNVVITLQERPGDVFDTIRKRIKDKRLRIRRRGTDYLTYALIDTIVDKYFHILENWEEKIEVLEEAILYDSTKSTLDQIYQMKHSLIFLKKAVAPIREMLDNLLQDELDLLKPETLPYIRDVYDHILQILDTIDNYREIIFGLIDAFNSIMGNRMNEVMKVLTIIATLFIPLTFIAGVYGMNFSYMPELGWKYGYFTVWGIMLVIAFIMIIYFKRKNWF